MNEFPVHLLQKSQKKKRKKKWHRKSVQDQEGCPRHFPSSARPTNTNTHTRARTHTERETRGGTHALAHARDHVRGVQVRY